MRLAETRKLVQLWRYVSTQKNSVVLMRHAPKAGSNDSTLSDEGSELARQYGELIAHLNIPKKPGQLILACTNKHRTALTLKLLFPHMYTTTYLRPADLEVNVITPHIQRQVDKLHREIGYRRGYYLNHTYYFLEQLGGAFDTENHTAIGKRIARGIRSLFDFNRTVIYCGHSPAIETGLEELLGKSLSELGGFLNPLDSIHLRMNEGVIEWFARINPIVDYVDLESETYFYDNP